MKIRKEKKIIDCEEAVQNIPCGIYKYFKGGLYEVIEIAKFSEDQSPVVVYKALYGDYGLWVRPADMWNETVLYNGITCKRFEKCN